MKWSTAVQELLALHEAFRKMGYPPGELFVATFKGDGAVQFVLRRGGQQFTVDVERGLEPAKVLEEWARAVTWWNNNETSDADRSRIYKGSRLIGGGNTVSLIAALKMRGFTAPIILN